MTLKHRRRFLAIVGVLLISTAASCSSASRGAHWKWDSDSVEGRTWLSLDGRELLSYRHIPSSFKPYIECFPTPAGTNVLRDAPHDHLHHHGLMYAVGVDGINFWAETEESGQQRVGSLFATAPASCGAWQRARLRNAVHWTTRSDQYLLMEKRTLDVYVGDDLDASLLTWQTLLAVHEDRELVRLHGERYYGLGIRFIESMDKNGRFFNADGAVGTEATNDVKSDWCAYSATADGHPVTVAMFNHPGNPRSPARWFSMDDPFAYLSLTPDLHHEELILVKGDSLLFRFGVALWDGHIHADQVTDLYEKWKALPVEQDW